MKGPILGLIVPACLVASVLLSPISLSQSAIPRGSVVISHLSPDYGLSSDEFIVLYNAGTDTVDLSGYEVRYFTASGSSGSAGHAFTETLLLAPGRHLLLASRDTVAVGSAIALTDAPLSSGMAATGGQLLLRRVGQPDSIVFAAAWGNVTNLVAGMTDAAPWSGDGMLGLTWQDSAYVRSAYNFSNIEYTHTRVDSIDVVPSLYPYSPSPHPTAWRISIAVSQGMNFDTSMVAGMDSSASDGFDALFDVPTPPTPPMTGVFVGFERSDLGLGTGDYLMRDIRALRSLSDTACRWVMDIVPVHVGIPVELVCRISGLPPGLPVMLRDHLTAGRINRASDSLLYSYLPTTTTAHRFELFVGDSTPPHAVFTAPLSGTSFVVGRPVTIQATVTERTDIDSLTIHCEDLSGQSVFHVVSRTDTLGEYSWTLPRRLLSDSARYRIAVQDMMGNLALAYSGAFRIVPDTARKYFSRGWHLFSTPFDPLERAPDRVIPNATIDSTYFFEYSRLGGYRLADSISPGRGYFLGLMNGRTLAITGRPPDDTLHTRLVEGFVLVSNPSQVPISSSHLEFTHHGLVRSYWDAVSSGIIGSGIFGYDPLNNSYVPVDTLQPWQGYWIPVLDSGITIRLASILGSSGFRRRAERSTAWSLRLYIATENRVDSLLSIGVSSSASNGFDPMLDIPAPPSPPVARGLTSSFDHSEWGLPTGPGFLSDVRKEGDAHEWLLSVRSLRPESVTLTWRVEHGIIPSDLRIEDPATGMRWMLNEVAAYQFAVTGEYGLQIRSVATGIQGTRGYPDRFEVGQNFPNPFNSSTTIDVSVPSEGRITIRLFDLLGREVAVLARENVQPGIRTYRWTADVPSGTYLCIATFEGGEASTSTTRLRRLLLIK
ncbi:MAG: lamin tail domain-containing protein [Bacteroidota bacterium]